MVYEPLIEMGFGWRTMARNTTRLLLTKSKLGQFYHPHHDSPILGEFSTSIILNDDFEGGELQLRVGSEVKNFKFKPGEAITYPTGMDHCVRPVTKGERKYWSFGLRVAVTDPLLREIGYSQIKLIIISVKKGKRKENPILFTKGIDELQRILFS